MKILSKKKNLIKKYYDSRSACQVLAGLMCNPKLLKRSEYILDAEDFQGGSHKTLFKCIYNLSQKGIEVVTLTDVDNYLSEVDPVGYKRLFEKTNGAEWITEILDDVNIDNFTYYYERLRKFALLRSYLINGVDVKGVLDLEEIDVETNAMQLTMFDKLSLEDIIKFFDDQNLVSKNRFTVRGVNQSAKSGDNARELRELLRQSSSYGCALEGEYITTATYGIQGGRVLVETRDSGCGKSRSSIKRLINYCSPYLWSYEEKDFIPNPNGQNNSGLYIGSEMEIWKELEPIIWCFIAGVEEDKMMDNELTEEEEERIDRAIEIAEQMQLYKEQVDDIGLNFIEQTIEKHKIEHNIGMVCIDYIEFNPILAQEYAQLVKGINVREDMMLLNASKFIKSISQKYDVFIIIYTQTNDEARRLGERDQTAIKGGKSLPNKADFGITVFEPTKKELEKLEPIIDDLKHKQKGLGKEPYRPNICISIYKNRWYTPRDAYKDNSRPRPRKIKIWSYQDLGTGYVKDLFVTDWDYELISIPRTQINNLKNSKE